MLPIFLGLGLIGGLVSLAIRQAKEPTIKPALEKRKLIVLAKIPRHKLTLSQAEDGVVLARRFSSPVLEKEFLKIVEKIKRKKK